MLAEKKALVTGSTQGIGLGIARVFLQHRVSHLVINGTRAPEDASSVLESLKSEFPDLHIFYIQANVSTADACRLLVSKSIELMGGIDILVNNAGIARIHTVDSFPDDDWAIVLATNLSAPFWLMKAVISHWKAPQQSDDEIPVWGRIVNISSVYGHVGASGRSAYVASKHGLNGLTKVVALELAESPSTNAVTVNAVCPGYVNTPLLGRLLSDTMAERHCSEDEARGIILSTKQPSKRFSECSDVGEYVAFLCSEAAKNVTGSCVVIDGGWTCQ